MLGKSGETALFTRRCAQLPKNYYTFEDPNLSVPEFFSFLEVLRDR